MSSDMAEEEDTKDRSHLAMVDHARVYLLRLSEGGDMLDQTIVIYCICDEVSKILKTRDDIQCKMTSAEVMTFAILSATLFGCDYKRTLLISKFHRYFRKILSHSQLVRRIIKFQALLGPWSFLLCSYF
jgi:hypothetical protein